MSNSKDVLKCMSEITGVNALKKKQYNNQIRAILQDPLLWLSLKYSDEDLTRAFGCARLSIQSLDGASTDWYKKRVHLCEDRTASDGKRQEDHLKVYFLTKGKTDASLRDVLFPRLPEPVFFAVPNDNVQNAPLQNTVVLASHTKYSADPKKGVITDLYDMCLPEGDGPKWEGYITITSGSRPTVYKFTSASCICAFPICLGSIVQFCVDPSSDNSSSLVTDGTLRVVQYFPRSLSADYAAQYLQQLDHIQEVSDRLSRILQLPGPLASIINEPRLYSMGSHQSQILALFNSISTHESSCLSEVLQILNIGTSHFIHWLPQSLCSRKDYGQASADVVHFIRLVALLVRSYPKYAYTMASVIQDTAKLVSIFKQEFTTEAADLSRAVIRACSVVRHEEEVPPEACDPHVDSLLDPLLWVRFFADKSVMQSLRKLIPQRPLYDDEGVVNIRKPFENIIVQALAETQHKQSLPVVRNMHLQPAHSHLSNHPIKKGIVTDLYSDGSGYIALVLSREYPSRQRLNQQVFQIDKNVTRILGTPPVIHIGDVVTFQVSEDSCDTAHQIVRVNQYCSNSLDESFGQEFFSSDRGLQALLKNEAAVKGIFNAPQVYRSRKVLTALFDSVTDALSDSTSSIKKRMLGLLKCSSFIRDLDKTTLQNVSKSVPVLECYLEQYPNEVCALESTLCGLVTHLLKQDKPQEVASFVRFLSTSSCLLPPSIEIQRQPWQSVPTILTSSECKAGAVENKDFLPHVKDRGCYSSVHEYGRTYFLLLRADCNGSLAKTILQLREQENPTNVATAGDVHTQVCDASFEGLSNRSSGRKLVYHFNVETRPLSAEQLSPDSPIFMQGNLLCFSVDGRFEDDIIWATINHIPSYINTAKTEDGLVKSSQVLVQFCTESNQCSDEEAMHRLKRSGNVVVLESPAYFKAYQPVLDALKKMDLQQIHFISDLINPGPHPQASLELIDDSTVVTDLAGLYKNDAGTIPTEMTVGELRVKLEEHREDLRLHTYQCKAVNQALSQALSLIQGPPGTGKSYMGMQLLRLFLSMKDGSGKCILEGKPALVMAYKNRALDHFILLCETFCPLKSIVRIGHVSKDNEEKLKPTLLREKVMTTLRSDYVALRKKLDDQYERVSKAREKLEAITKLEALEDCVGFLTPDMLKSIVVDGKEYNTQAEDEVVKKVNTDPETCLKLLQRRQMGKADLELKKAIEKAIENVWDKWVAGASSCQKPTVDFKVSHRGATLYEENDTEYEIDYYEEENSNEVERFTHTFYDDLDQDATVKVSNMWELNADCRRLLITSFFSYHYDMAMEELKESMREYNMILEIYEKKYEEVSLRVLRGAKIVAMTTTGAAIHQRLLNQLEAPVVFVEEAAEILESNILAILTPHVKHMVLIGDHKQLKPNLAWSRLERHKFNLSLFERLVRNKYPHTLLLRQHRMHPTLVPLYEYHYCYGGDARIHSNKKVDSLDKPKCMRNNFFWWSYEGKYESKRENSQYNTHEVEMVVSLCSWLVCNRVAATSIAVLTPYRGQLEEVKQSLQDKAHSIRLMPSALVDIEVYTVDEYQGHENDVVILSLVRSNSTGKIGFLSRHNRLVVGTSRQKSALYIVGNHTFLEKSSQNLWKKFIEKCKERDSESIGSDLPIVVADSLVFCKSVCELDERMKVTANNESVASANSDLDRSTPTATTPAPVRSLSATSTPNSMRSVSAVSSPSTPPASAPPDTPSTRLHFSPPSPQMSSASVSSGSPHSGHAVRQQSSPALLHSHQPGPRERSPGDDEACVSSSTTGWDYKKYALKLKDTAAATKWKFIGRQLGLEEHVISAIEKKSATDIKESFYQMLLKWKATKGEKATKDELLKALETEQLKQVVEDLHRMED